MAKREVSREPTTIGRFMSWFVMVNLSVVTRTHETSDAAPAAAVDGPDTIAVRITTDTSTPQQEVAPHNDNPVIRIVQEKELGKAFIPIAVAIASTTIVVAGNDNLSETGMTLILVLVSLGIAAICSGILLKETYDKFAKTVEALGIIMVVVSFYAVVAFFLPVWVVWVPAVCLAIILIVIPFVIVVRQPAPT